jgi:hypothetical protein
LRISFLAFLTLTTTSALASTLSVKANLDNSFGAYISTSDALLGNLVGSGANWRVTSSFSAILTPGVTNYIHIVAVNSGGPGGFLGEFSISDDSFQFANGTQHLLTNTSSWNFSMTGFGGPYVSAGDEGANGISPWLAMPTVASNARWIWDRSNCPLCTVYFQAPITANVTNTPEPAASILLAGGLALLWLGWRQRPGYGRVR